jgi:hypothetical protein
MNIGLIANFPQANKLEFIHPEKLTRLKNAYSNVPEKTINAYFSYFRDRVVAFNHAQHLLVNLEAENNFQLFIENEFLAADSSVLQFGNYRNVLQYTPDINKITSQLFDLYLQPLELNRRSGNSN